MPQPALNQTHIDKALTNVSVAYLQDPERFIAGKVFPRIPVDFKTDKYWTFPKEAFFRDDMKRRAPATESEGSGWTLSTDAYSCDVWALHKDLDNQTVNNTDAAIDLENVTMAWLTQQAKQRRENQFVSNFLKTGVWGTDVLGSANPLWSDYTSGDPIGQIADNVESIEKTTGQTPNTLILGYRVFKYLKNHPALLERIMYTQRGQLTEDLLASLFEVENVHVARAIRNTAEEGQAGSFNFTFANDALLCYVAPNPGLMAPSAGYTFEWTGVSDGYILDDGTPATVGAFRFPMPHLRAERFEIEMAWANKVVAPDLGVYFSAVVA